MKYRQVGVLILGVLLFWAAVAVPARRLGGDESAVQAAAAMGLCLFPASLSLLAAAFVARRAPEAMLAVLMGGSAARLLLSLAGALVLYLWIPYFQNQPGFLVWVLVFYLYTLAFEVALAVRGLSGSRVPLGQKTEAIAPRS